MKAILALHLLLAWSTVVNAAFKCSLCQDGFSPSDESQVINLRGKDMTCEDAHLQGVMTFQTRYECDFLRNLGQFLCICKEGNGPNVKQCKLCQDGSSLPNPNAQPWPGFSCIDLESTATRNDVCPLYQKALAQRVVQHDALAAQPDVQRVKDDDCLCPVTIARLSAVWTRFH
ncbi:hypothetical protein MHU86_5554 [Fragilaria crotonensis]|nr:hypothetical protein MHU86_5554 [Fragilaria crotonensis]